MSDSSDNTKKSDSLTDQLIQISIEEKEEKEAKVIELKKEIEHKYYGVKKPIIVELKDSLINEGFPKDHVLSEIIRRMKGYITESYIRKCIDDPELKDQSKVRTPMMVTNDGQTVPYSESENQDDDNDNNENVNNNGQQYVFSKQDADLTKVLNEKHELEEKIRVMESERAMNTTATLNPNMYQNVYNMITDKKIKRVLLDFNDDMVITGVRAIL